jgi:UDP-N-acetylmuramate: L-alanyl-gamma-D-glutamyl-meso-diaminopimelate ligase
MGGHVACQPLVRAAGMPPGSSTLKHVHILGACGTFMGGVAAIASEAGYRVTGADRNIYPPMSDQLARLGVELTDGYDPAQLSPAPDMVVVGNVMSRGMPVIEALLDSGIPYFSGPEWLRDHVLRDRWVIGVAGTHGKTTTTSLLAHILEQAGLEPGFLIGGAPADFPFSARLGRGRPFVIEADEYDTAFFDKRAKFLLYRPRTVIINNIEYDHADIYPDLAAILRQFHQLVRAVPPSGRLIVPGADGNVASLLAQGCWTPVTRFGSEQGAGEWTGCEDPPGTFRLSHGDDEVGAVPWQLSGAHNVENAVAALLAAAEVGVAPATALAAIGSFRGVARRLQLLGDFGGVRLFDDFAHHPTAIRRTIEGLRRRPGVQRVLAVFEPRSNSMKLGAYREPLAAAFDGADAAWIHQSPGLQWDVAAVFAGRPRARVVAGLPAIVGEVAAASRPGDVVVVMSNGDFGNVRGALRDVLAARAGAS